MLQLSTKKRSEGERDDRLKERGRGGTERGTKEKKIRERKKKGKQVNENLSKERWKEGRRDRSKD